MRAGSTRATSRSCQPAAICSTASTRARSASDDAAGWSGWKAPKNVHVVADPGARVDGSRLKRRAAGLVLQALRGEGDAEAKRDSIGVAVGGTHQLAEVGGESGGALEAAVRGPGMRAALREILSAHHDRIGARMARDEVIEILARIGLVAHQETGIAEAKILNEQSVAGQLGFASVLDREPP